MSEALTPNGIPRVPPLPYPVDEELPLDTDDRLRTILAVLLNRLGGEATIERHELNGVRPAHIIPQTNGDTKVSADKDFARCGS